MTCSVANSQQATDKPSFEGKAVTAPKTGMRKLDFRLQKERSALKQTPPNPLVRRRVYYD